MLRIVAANSIAIGWRGLLPPFMYRGSREGRPLPYGFSVNVAATSAFPKEGKGDREAVDEDVGTCFTGKCFDVRLHAGVRYSFVDRGSRTINDRPYELAGNRIVYTNGIVPHGLSGRPVPTGL